MCMCNQKKGTMGIFKSKNRDLSYIIPSNPHYHGIRPSLFNGNELIINHQNEPNSKIKSREFLPHQNHQENDAQHPKLINNADYTNNLKANTMKSNPKQVSITSVNYAKMIWGIVFAIVIGIIIGLITGISFVCKTAKGYDNIVS